MPLSSDITTARAHYEVVVIGSGYGGAVAASRMARAFRDVCVLERGREFVAPGFPSTTMEILSQIQVDTPSGHRGPETGLYDFRSNPQVWAVVACGLGGGSLINAGVVLRPRPSVFADPRWPPPLRLRSDGTLPDDLEAAYRRARDVLSPEEWPADMDPPPRLRRMQEIADALDAPMTKTPVNVAFKARTNPFHVEQKACKLCGDCVSGCNHGSKGTLSTSYLADAWNLGAHLFTKVSVSHLARVAGEWVVHWTALHDDGHELFHGFTRAGHVILAAGTFGSTQILLRSRKRGLSLSSKVGTRFSANGDVFAFSWAGKDRVDAIGLDGHPIVGPDLPGPTILGVVDLRGAASAAEQMVIEDGVIPGGLLPLSLVRVAEEVEAQVARGETDPARAEEVLGGVTAGDAMGVRRGGRAGVHGGSGMTTPPKYNLSIQVSTTLGI